MYVRSPHMNTCSQGVSAQHADRCLGVPCSPTCVLLWGRSCLRRQLPLPAALRAQSGRAHRTFGAALLPAAQSVGPASEKLPRAGILHGAHQPTVLGRQIVVGQRISD